VNYPLHAPRFHAVVRMNILEASRHLDPREFCHGGKYLIARLRQQAPIIKHPGHADIRTIGYCTTWRWKAAASINFSCTLQRAETAPTAPPIETAGIIAETFFKLWVWKCRRNVWEFLKNLISIFWKLLIYHPNLKFFKERNNSINFWIKKLPRNVYYRQINLRRTLLRSSVKH